MAILIKMDGTKSQVEIEGEHLSITQISKILECVIEPLFFGDVWAFSERFIGQVAGRNETVSEAFASDLYGDVILASDSELSPSFFFPPEIKKDIQEMSRNMYEQQKAKGSEEETQPETEESLAAKQEDAEKKIKMNQDKILALLEEGYNVMVASGKTFEELVTELQIFQVPGQDGALLEGVNGRIHYLNGMIEHFTKKEEYEKCVYLTDFKTYLENRK